MVKPALKDDFNGSRPVISALKADRTGVSVDVCHLQGLFGYSFGGIILSSLGCFHRLRNILICVVVFCGVLYQKLY